MNRNTLNLIIDVVAFVGFVVLTTTGIFLHFVLGLDVVGNLQQSEMTVPLLF